jgi:hypothetical protein
MTILGGLLLYLGLMSAAAGVLSLPIPLRFLGIRTRKRGLLVLALGIAALVAGVYLPVSQTRVETARTRLDEFMPVYQFSESHSVDVRASREQIWRAMWEVRPEEIRFFKTLMWMRGLGNSMAPQHRPILESFTAAGFQLLAEDRGREIVIGRAGDGRGASKLSAEEFKAIHQAPLVKIAMNFRIQEVDGAHSTLSTETRVYAAGPRVVRGFATYWRMIYPGSSLIRHMWLRAIKLRAEAR